MFVPLHVKSEHSLGCGTAAVEDLARRAATVGYRSLALTDIENLYGQVKFHRAARHAGIRPITGVELREGYGPRTPGRIEGRLILLARDRDGYRSLCRILTARHGGSARVSSDPLECLELDAGGVFHLSDDLQVIERLLAAGIPADDVRHLVIEPGVPTGPRAVRRMADLDAVMLDPDDADLHALLAAVRQRVRFGRAVGVQGRERSLADPDEVARRFRGEPRALEESARVAEACRLDLGDEPPRVPQVELPAGIDADEALARRVRSSLALERGLGRMWEARYEHRLEQELRVIRGRDLAAYFLIVAEIGDHARREGIELVGRGSAAGSLVVHLLGLSGADPVRHGLLFERFLNEGRGDLPDVDLDVPSSRRDGLIDWVFERFGAERVAMVSTHTTFGRRAAARAALQAFGAPAAEIARLAAEWPSPELDDDCEGPLPLGERGVRARPLARLAERLVGRPQHVAAHPGGVVIAEPRITDFAPLERAPKGVRVTQYDLRSLAALGLVKIDLLGNRALSAIHDAGRWARVPAEVPEDDAPTLELLRSGDTVGCFQIETPAVRSVLRRLPLRGLEDLVDALAIVRPGPASGEAKETFLRRARGEEPVPSPIPELRDVLARTRGMLLYEEDVIATVAAVTGWSLARADATRAALVSTRDDLGARETEKGSFLAACLARGVAAEEAAAIWASVERFAAYSFNRAHATSYAQVAWRCAWLKTHHPLPYACGVLAHDGGAYPLRTVAGDFARRGLTIRAPHVHSSRETHAPEGVALRLGLAAISRLTRRTRARILSDRPFADLRDLIARARPSRPELEALVLCGACDDLAPLRAADYPFAHEAFLAAARAAGAARALERFATPHARGAKVELYRDLVRVFQEIRFLGMHPTRHPMAVLRDEATRVGCLPSDALASRIGRPTRFAGVVAAGRRLVTRTGGVMHFVTFEDERGLIEAAVFPGIFAALRDPVRNPGPYLVRGRMAGEPRDPLLEVTDVLPFHLRDTVKP